MGAGKMENGKWKMGNGEWGMENGEWSLPLRNALPILAFSLQAVAVRLETRYDRPVPVQFLWLPATPTYLPPPDLSIHHASRRPNGSRSH